MIAIGTMDRRTMVMGGAAVVVLAAAAGWYFYGDELLSPEPPKPMAAAPKPVPKPAPKPAAQPAAQAAQPAAQTAAPGAQPGAKPTAAPVPGKPEDAVAEMVMRAGLGELGEALRDFALQGMDAAPDRPADLSPAAAQAYRDAIIRVLAPNNTNERFRAQLVKTYEPAAYGSFIQLLRQPINEKMTKLETERPTAEQAKQFFESLRSKPLTPGRQQLIGRIDTASHSSEIAAESSIVVIRGMLAGGVIGQKTGASSPEQTLAPLRKGAQAQARALLAFTYRAASDAELKEYATLLESDAGKRGTTLLATAFKSVLDTAAQELAIELERVAAEQRAAAKVVAAAPATEKAPAMEAKAEAPKPEAGETKPAAKPAMAEQAAAPKAEEPDPAVEEARRAAAEERRRANLPPVYSRYNDLVTAVTMQDRNAAYELLDDGKDPNTRASNGRTALMIAVGLRNLEIVNLLLEKGANPNLRAPGGVSALKLAREASATEIEGALAKHGASD